MRPPRIFGFAAMVAAIALAAACGSAPSDQGAERTATRSEALSSTSFVGTSLASKTLVLTFDDGPGYGTSGVSTYLASQGIPATFFLNGAYIATTTLPNDNGIKLTPNASTLLAQLVADGHLVANHGTTHRNLTTVLADFGAATVIQELAETDTDIAGHVPSNHFLFRAPYGAYGANVWNALAPSAMNKYVGDIGWDIGGATSNYPAQAADWACWVNALRSGGGGPTFGATPQQCGDAYLTEIAAVGRGIVLMHDSSHTDNDGTTLAMLEYIVPILKTQGYTFARADDVPELAALLPPAPGPGPADASAPAKDGGPIASDGGEKKPSVTPDASDAANGADAASGSGGSVASGGSSPSDDGAKDGAGEACSLSRTSARDEGAGAFALAIGALAAALLRRRKAPARLR